VLEKEQAEKSLLRGQIAQGGTGVISTEGGWAMRQGK